MPQFVSQADFARELGVTLPRVCQLVTRGQVKHEVIAGRRVIYRASADQYVRRRAERRIKEAARRASTHATP